MSIFNGRVNEGQIVGPNHFDEKRMEGRKGVGNWVFPSLPHPPFTRTLPHSLPAKRGKFQKKTKKMFYLNINLFKKFNFGRVMLVMGHGIHGEESRGQFHFLLREIRNVDGDVDFRGSLSPKDFRVKSGRDSEMGVRKSRKEREKGR